MNCDYHRTAKILKALSDPKRLQIVDMLSGEEMCAGRILEAFQVSQPTLSHDMKLLIEAGLVLDRREGKRVLYTLNHEVIGQLISTLQEVTRDKVQA